MSVLITIISILVGGAWVISGQLSRRTSAASTSSKCSIVSSSGSGPAALGVSVPSRQRRTRSWQEARANVRRAKQFTERYGLDESNPADFMPPTDEHFDDLLRHLK
jgi:hypothetical protein